MARPRNGMPVITDAMREKIAQEMRIRLRNNPLRWTELPDGRIERLQFTPKQLEAWGHFDEVKKLIGMVGANRFGKTFWAGCVCAQVATGLLRTDWPDLPRNPASWALGPPRTIWCITTTFEKSRDVQQKEIWERIPPALWKRGTRWDKKSGFHNHVAELKNDTAFVFKSEEQKLITFEGSKIHLAWIDEAIKPPFFLAVLPRTVDYRAPIIWTALWEHAFIEDLFYHREFSPDMKNVIPADQVGLVQGQMSDNPHLSASEIELVAGVMSRKDRRMRIEGLPTIRGGLVYGEFSVERHHRAVEAPLSPEAWSNRFELIDPGWANHCAVLFGYIGPGDVAVIYDEIYRQERTVGQLAAEIFLKRWSLRGVMTPAEIEEYENAIEAGSRDGEGLGTIDAVFASNKSIQATIDRWKKVKGDLRPRVVLMDEYAKQHDQAKQLSMLQLMRQMRIHAQPASNADKRTQRFAVRELLTPMNGLIRLYVDTEQCEWTVWEFRHHRYKEVDPELGEHKGKTEPVVDGHNHALNCIEYYASHKLKHRPLGAGAAPSGTVAAMAQEAKRRRHRA